MLKAKKVKKDTLVKRIKDLQKEKTGIDQVKVLVRVDDRDKMKSLVKYLFNKVEQKGTIKKFHNEIHVDGWHLITVMCAMQADNYLDENRMIGVSQIFTEAFEIND